ncbi:MAG: glycosyltransferase family 2 protein [Nitrospinota bacterium]
MKNIVIAPLYNEVNTLKDALYEIKKYHNGDILVIDDGSTDGSDKIVESLPFVKVIYHKTNQGYGASLNSGFRFAIDNQYDLLVTCDLDEQHEPKLIPKMFSLIEDNDILSGSRYLEKSSNGQSIPPRGRKDVNRKVTAIINRLTNYNLTDGFCGFKGYKVSALRILNLNEKGYAHPLQGWIQASKLDLKVKEVAVPMIYKNMFRSFGNDLDDDTKRLEYYINAIKKEVQQCQLFSLSELTQMISTLE